MKQITTLNNIKHSILLLNQINDTIQNLMSKYKYYEEQQLKERTILQMFEHHAKWIQTYQQLIEAKRWQKELVQELMEYGMNFTITYKQIETIVNSNRVPISICVAELQ